MKTKVDIDDDALRAAAQELGTTPKKDTVNAALAFVAVRDRRAAGLDPQGAGSGHDPSAL